MRSGVSTSAGLPVATARPPSSRHRRSQYRAARFRSCNATSAGRPSSRTRPSSSSWWRTSRWLVGSSITSRDGRPTRARATSARCRSPPDRVPKRRPASPVRSSSSRPASTRAWSTGSSAASGRLCGERPIATTSRTVSGKSVGMSCTTTPTRCATHRTGRSRISVPSTSTVPEAGVLTRYTVRSSEDLPLPLGPSRPTTSPGPTVSDTPPTSVARPAVTWTSRISSGVTGGPPGVRRGAAATRRTARRPAR